MNQHKIEPSHSLVDCNTHTHTHTHTHTEDSDDVIATCWLLLEWFNVVFFVFFGHTNYFQAIFLLACDTVNMTLLSVRVCVCLSYLLIVRLILFC